MGDLGILRDRLRELDRVVIAFSGGADSAFLAWVANDTLGADHAVAVTAVSPSLASVERDDCAALADDWGLRWLEVATDEMTNAAYRKNDADRCFHCKDALMDALAPVAARETATVVLGVNVDDLGEHRPGQEAAMARGAEFPLVDAGFSKSDVRSFSHELGLTTWDKPAAACLASRIPYGTAVSVGVLGQIERAERGLRSLGFPSLRVRHYDDTARIEVPIEDLQRLVEHRDEVVTIVRESGYAYVTLDLEGLRSGNLNNALSS
jgi:uncharacterized protein